MKTSKRRGSILWAIPVLWLGSLSRGDASRPGGPPVEAAADYSVVLGRPTEASITANVLSAQAAVGYLEYGATPSLYDLGTAAVPLPAGTPVEMLMAGLQPDTKYYYRLRIKIGQESVYASGPGGFFHTRRAPGSRFVFAVQTDSHPEREKSMFNPELYARTLALAAADQPDFFITLGDDFSVDTLKERNPDTVGGLYAVQRRYLEPLIRSCPVFLVNGNHEQAAAYLLDGTPDNVAVWAQNARNRSFPQPAPDAFYSGDATPVPHIGLLRDYYAWTWGDALFVVIDPYWHSPVAVDNDLSGADKKKDRWLITLGEDQYRWFKETLERSAAKHKFVFTHQVNGTGRGGIGLADQFEWGGYNDKGVWEFDAKRPGWGLPIHRLMAENKVTVFFHGHDHLFAKETLDGVIYQECPIPADDTYTAFNEDAYPSGITLPNAGYLRVTVSAADVVVEYVRSYLPGGEPAGHKHGEVAASYSLNQRAKKGGIRRIP